MVGHSLGAHAAGIAGKYLKSGQIPIIFGLDPAFPLFTKKNTRIRLTPSDAKYVQVIHTGTARLSISYPVGHADFYPNWGEHQPGCKGRITGINSMPSNSFYSKMKSYYYKVKRFISPNKILDKCSHGRSHEFFIESLSLNSKFEGTHCASYEEIENQRCTETGPRAVMGGDEPEEIVKANGVYYLATNLESPFSKNVKGVLPEEYQHIRLE